MGGDASVSRKDGGVSGIRMRVSFMLLAMPV